MVGVVAATLAMVGGTAQATTSSGTVAPVVTPVSPTAESETGSAPPTQYWYGWQTLLADAAAVAVGSGCLYLYAKDVIDADDGTGCFVPFLLAAPGVHLVRRGPLRAVGSFGLRVGLPLLGLLAGLAGSDGNGDHGNSAEQSTSNFDGAAVGLVAGLTLGILLDTVFAFAPVDPSPPPPARAHVAPTLYLRPGGGTIGLAATF